MSYSDIKISNHQDILQYFEVDKSLNELNIGFDKITINKLDATGYLSTFGIKGQKGQKGNIGLKGLKGTSIGTIIGDKGQKGEPGQTISGSPGSSQTNTVGSKGYRGRTGNDSTATIKGYNGDKGSKGYTITGNTGTTGASITGQKGDERRGTKGSTGATGSAGSALGSYSNNKYTLTASNGYSADLTFKHSGATNKFAALRFFYFNTPSFLSFGGTIRNYCVAFQSQYNGTEGFNGIYAACISSAYLYISEFNSSWSKTDNYAYFLNHNPTGSWYSKRIGDVYIDFTGQHSTFNFDINTIKYTGYITVSTGLYFDRNKKQIFSKNNTTLINTNDTLPLITFSNKTNQCNVYGVISNYYDHNEAIRTSSQDYENCIHVNSLGDGAIWVSDMNGILENGDYITTSDIPGIGMKQHDDIYHSYTVAKITMDCDFNPKLLEYKYIESKETKSNVTDIENFIPNKDYNGDYVFTSDDTLQHEYRLKYVRLDGTLIDRDTYENEKIQGYNVYRMAFVACTYHCG